MSKLQEFSIRIEQIFVLPPRTPFPVPILWEIPLNFLQVMSSIAQHTRMGLHFSVSLFTLNSVRFARLPAHSHCRMLPNVYPVPTRPNNILRAKFECFLYDSIVLYTLRLAWQLVFTKQTYRIFEPNSTDQNRFLLWCCFRQTGAQGLKTNRNRILATVWLELKSKGFAVLIVLIGDLWLLWCQIDICFYRKWFHILYKFRRKS